jgi:hypothetical protein
MGWMCIGLPQFVAGVDVEERHDEEDHGEQEHESILHAKTPGSLSTEMDLPPRRQEAIGVLYCLIRPRSRDITRGKARRPVSGIKRLNKTDFPLAQV